MVIAKVFKMILWLVAAALIGLLLAMVVIPRLLGWVPLTVLSGSMEPTIPVGSQIVVKPVEANTTINNGQIITFMPRPDDPTLVTHRVVGKSIDGAGKEEFITRGDANNANDPVAVERKQVRGVLMYHLPWVGYLALSIDGKIKVLGITAVALLLLGYAAWQTIRILSERRQHASQTKRAHNSPAEPSEDSHV